MRTAPSPVPGYWLGLALLAAGVVAPGAGRAASYATIIVDGDVSDWTGIPAAYVDPAGDNAGTTLDLGRVFVANDDRFVYLRFDIGPMLNLPQLPRPLRIYLDTDHSAATGYAFRGIGSDLLVECTGSGSGIRFYECTAGNRYAAQIGFAALDAYQGPTVAATEFELRLLRGTIFPIRHTAVFPGASFRIVLEAVDAGGLTGDAAPDAMGGIECSTATGTPPLPPARFLGRMNSKDVRLMNWNVHQDGMFGSESARFTRVLQAMQPDVVTLQELYNTDPATVAARLDTDLPLPGGAHWVAFKGARSQVTASRYPETLDAGAPFLDLATLVDLPNGDYAVDLYVIDSHLKCCGAIGTSEDVQRQASADAIVAWLKDLRTPGGAQLPAGTPIVQLGDMNLVGGPQPLVTLLTGDIVDEATYGPDSPPDWDGTARVWDHAPHSDGYAAYSWRSDGSNFLPGKLDYAIVTESVARIENRFLLNTLDMSPERLVELGLQAEDTHLASDHLPLVVDILPGAAGVAGVVEKAASALRMSIAPNPTRGALSLRIELPRRGALDVGVYDLAGRRLRTLARGERAAGPQLISWDGRDEGGRPLESGIYIVSARHSGASAVQRVALVR